MGGRDYRFPQAARTIPGVLLVVYTANWVIIFMFLVDTGYHFKSNSGQYRIDVILDHAIQIFEWILLMEEILPTMGDLPYELVQGFFHQ